MGKRSNFERRANDAYPTPREAVLPLVPHLRGMHVFAEPCAGDGALVRHLESCGLRCVYAGDLADGQDALAIPRFDAPVITNPPWSRDLLHRLIEHFVAAAPFTWLLFDANWAHTRQSRELIRHCSQILPIGRVRWIPYSPYSGKDDAAWFRFDRGHEAGPILHPYRAEPVRHLRVWSAPPPAAGDGPIPVAPGGLARPSVTPGSVFLRMPEMEHTIVFHDLVIGGSAQRPAPRPRKRLDNILPANLPPLGLTLEEVAAFVGISPNKYSDLIRRGLMPSARLVDGRRVHDREAAHAAFKRLPTTMGNGGDIPTTGDDRPTSTWEDVDNAP
jgi:hypothetical protein